MSANTPTGSRMSNRKLQLFPLNISVIFKKGNSDLNQENVNFRKELKKKTTVNVECTEPPQNKTNKTKNLAIF